MQHVLKAHFLKACDVTTAHGLTVYQTQTLIEPDNKPFFVFFCFLEVIERLELGE